MTAARMNVPQPIDIISSTKVNADFDFLMKIFMGRCCPFQTARTDREFDCVRWHWSRSVRCRPSLGQIVSKDCRRDFARSDSPLRWLYSASIDCNYPKASRWGSDSVIRPAGSRSRLPFRPDCSAGLPTTSNTSLESCREPAEMQGWVTDWRSG